MTDFIAWMIIIAIIGAALSYVIIQKRKGVKCIGCASEGKCTTHESNKNPCDCGCDKQ